MKVLVPLVTCTLFASLAGCTTEPEPQLGTTSAAVTFPPVGPDQFQSEEWVVGKNSASDLWPANANIVTTQILYRKGPPRCASDVPSCATLVPTFIAVVVWNHATVGHIYWINETQNGPGVDFKAKLNVAMANHLNGFLNHWGGGTGGPGGGEGPMPVHPHIFVASQAFIDNSKIFAGQIDQANMSFTGTPMQ